MQKFKYLIIFLLSGLCFKGLAQTDSLVLKNGDVIIGEIKQMNKGVLTIETSYSDSDFKIEWDGITEIISQTSFLITMSDGTRYNGRLKSKDDDMLAIILFGNEVTSIIQNDIVFLDSVDKDFLGRLSASIELGYNFTKANDLRQFSIRSGIGYKANKWSSNFSYNQVFSSQKDVEDIQRTDASITYRYYLPNDWYLIPEVIFLSNTEQKIKLRTNTKLGFGKYVLHTNSLNWGFHLGAAFNNETFQDESNDKQSVEGYFGTELDIFDLGDLSLITRVIAYPSFTERGRWRTDANFDMKYDLPLDFYFKIGITLNFDNQPVENAGRTDYVTQTSFGWEL